ncbi:MAG: AAA family ATPase, partial [Chloroflexota bacterium]
MQKRITDDLHDLLIILPPAIGAALTAANRTDDLLEVILDLGRVPTARYVDGEVRLTDTEVTHDDINTIVSRIGEVDADNRAGIERTLHRISAIRNRRGHIVGLTCRVGRAVYGTTDIIKDLIESGKSILMLGRPGIGKTTMLREAARILAEKKRVVIVDTSNEIAGDGDVPHPAVGRARRMQVAQPNLQHEVMIEAVENHNPEVIVIDEIGRELEAAAARTIAERGVQLIGTAHGNSLDNILLNPTLSDLVGGIEAVTLSDEEARRRGTQKTVLERRAPPTFDFLIEIQERERLILHEDLALAVDGLLRGRPLVPQLRFRDENGQMQRQAAPPPPAAPDSPFGRNRREQQRDMFRDPLADMRSRRREPAEPARPANGSLPFSPTPPHIPQAAPLPSPSDGAPVQNRRPLPTLRVFPFGISRDRVEQTARRLHVPVEVTRDPLEAQALVTLKANYRRGQRAIADAENAGIPIYVLRANTLEQLENFLGDLFNLPSRSEAENTDHELDRALQETRQAIEAVRNGVRSVDLAPVSSYLRRVQHQIIRDAELVSHS